MNNNQNNSFIVKLLLYPGAIAVWVSICHGAITDYGYGYTFSDHVLRGLMLFGIGIIADLLVYADVIMSLSPEETKNDLKYKRHIFPIVSWSAVIILLSWLVSTYYRPFKYPGTVALSFLFASIAVCAYRVYKYVKVNDKLEDLNNVARDIVRFYMDNADNKTGKFIYVYCIGTIEAVFKTPDHPYGTYFNSYSIYRVPDSYIDMARIGNVAVAKRYLMSESDEEMIITKVFTSDSDPEYIPVLTSIEEPYEVFETGCIENHPYDPRAVHPCIINAYPFEVWVKTLGPSKEDDYKLNILRPQSKYDKPVDCFIPTDIPVDKLNKRSFVMIHTDDGDDLLAEVRDYTMKGHKSKYGWYADMLTMDYVAKSMADAETEKDEFAKADIYDLAVDYVVHDPNKYLIKALINYRPAEPDFSRESEEDARNSLEPVMTDKARAIRGRLNELKIYECHDKFYMRGPIEKDLDTKEQVINELERYYNDNY